MKYKIIPNILTTPISLMILSAASLNATVIYTENFDNSTSENQSSSFIGWEAYTGTSATDISANAPNSGNRMGLSNLSGNPSSSDGYFFAANSGSGTQDQIWAGINTGLSLSNVSEISWRMGNSTTVASVKLLVEVGGQWYASATSFSNSNTYNASSFSSGADTPDIVKNLTFSTDAADWLELNLDPGNSLNIASSPISDLPTSTVTGIGFFVDSGNTFTTVRLDSLEISAATIPEPSSFALMLILGATSLAVRRARPQPAPTAA